MSDYSKFEILHLTCVCSQIEHTIRFIHDPEDRYCPIYTEVSLTQYHGFWKRVWLAIKYILGGKSDQSHFDCFIMDKNAAIKLQAFIEQAYANVPPVS